MTSLSSRFNSVSFRFSAATRQTKQTLVIACYRAPLVFMALLVFAQCLHASTQQRISAIGGLGDNGDFTEDPAVAYNATQGEFLVVWEAGWDTDGPITGDREIWGRRIDGRTGAPIGPEFQITHFGPEGDDQARARDPRLVFNPDRNEFLLAFIGRLNSESETYGVVLGPTGLPVTAINRLSQAGPDGDSSYSVRSLDVTYSTSSNEYLVVWSGDDDRNGHTNREHEIFAQLVDAATGSEIGTDDIQVSNTGPVADSAYDAENPRVIYDSNSQSFVVVWSADDTVGGQVEGEAEIFLQILHGTLAIPLLSQPNRVSEAGGEYGNDDTSADTPTITYNPADLQYLVAWTERGPDGIARIKGRRLNSGFATIDLVDRTLVDERTSDSPRLRFDPVADQYVLVYVNPDDTPPAGIGWEIFSQRLARDGAPSGLPLRESFMGNTPDSFEAEWPDLEISPTSGRVLVVWAGDHDADGQVDDEYETFIRFNAPSLFASGFESGSTGGWSSTSN